VQDDEDSVCYVKGKMPIQTDPHKMPRVIFVPGNMGQMHAPLSGGGFVNFMEKCFGRHLLDGAVIANVHIDPDKKTGWCTHTLSTGHVLCVVAPHNQAPRDKLGQKYGALRRHLTQAFAYVATTPAIRDETVWTPLFGTESFLHPTDETALEAANASSAVVEETAKKSRLKVVVCDPAFVFAADRT
jgi:hypothetical protein